MLKAEVETAPALGVEATHEVAGRVIRGRRVEPEREREVGAPQTERGVIRDFQMAGPPIESRRRASCFDAITDAAHHPRIESLDGLASVNFERPTQVRSWRWLGRPRNRLGRLRGERCKQEDSKRARTRDTFEMGLS